MGRFETSVYFYAHREPYPRLFFQRIAEQMGVGRETRLLDVGTGPGILAIGFARHAGACTGIDSEPAMIRAAEMAAAQAGVNVRFREVSLEGLDDGPASFDVVTIGRALHWLSREAALPVLDRILPPSGWIAVCGSTASANSTVNTWNETYRQIRNAFTTDPNQGRYKPDLDQWFLPSRFRRAEDIAVEHRRQVSVDDLIARALSFSTTSPAVLGARQPQFEEDIRAALEPFARDGFVEEELRATATVFR